MEDKVFIGVDPGKDGALAVIWPGRTPHIETFDEAGYADILSGLSGSPAFAVVEHVGAMPGQGVSSCFTFGRNFGLVLGMLTALRIPYELVRPQKWKREYSCTSDKNTSVEVARRLFPDVSLRRTDRCKKDHDGMAEALLMAEYARRKFGGANSNGE